VRAGEEGRRGAREGHGGGGEDKILDGNFFIFFGGECPTPAESAQQQQSVWGCNLGYRLLNCVHIPRSFVLHDPGLQWARSVRDNPIVANQCNHGPAV